MHTPHHVDVPILVDRVPLAIFKRAHVQIFNLAPMRKRPAPTSTVYLS